MLKWTIAMHPDRDLQRSRDLAAAHGQSCSPFGRFVMRQVDVEV
jgi:hypothetical protein